MGRSNWTIAICFYLIYTTIKYTEKNMGIMFKSTILNNFIKKIFNMIRFILIAPALFIMINKYFESAYHFLKLIYGIKTISAFWKIDRPGFFLFLISTYQSLWYICVEGFIPSIFFSFGLMFGLFIPSKKID